MIRKAGPKGTRGKSYKKRTCDREKRGSNGIGPGCYAINYITRVKLKNLVEDKRTAAVTVMAWLIDRERDEQRDVLRDGLVERPGELTEANAIK